MKSKSSSKKTTSKPLKSEHPFDGIDKPSQIVKDQYTSAGQPFNIKELRKDVSDRMKKLRGSK